MTTLSNVYIASGASMFHSTPDQPVLMRQWRWRPPTGRQMSDTLCGLMLPEDVEAQLAHEVNRSVTYVRWCLVSDAIVPASLLAAALRLGDRVLPPLQSHELPTISNRPK